MLRVLAAASAAHVAAASMPLDTTVVLLSPNASMGDQFAAAEMAWFGGNISAGNVPLRVQNISTSSLPPADASLVIAVGYDAALAVGVPAAQLADLGPDGLRITVASASNHLKHNTVALSGGPSAPRGTLYAVYEFLEHNGLEIIAWDATVLPAGSPNVPLRQPGADIVQVPDYESRDLGEWPVFSNRLHCRRMRLNRCSDNTICSSLDSNDAFCRPPHNWDSFQFASPPGMAHTIYRLLCTNGTHIDPVKCPALKPPQDLIKTHPEWFWPHGDADTCKPAIPHSFRLHSVPLETDDQVLCATTTDGQVCYHNASLREFLVSQVKLVLKCVNSSNAPEQLCRVEHLSTRSIGGRCQSASLNHA